MFYNVAVKINEDTIRHIHICILLDNHCFTLNLYKNMFKGSNLFFHKLNPGDNDFIIYIFAISVKNVKSDKRYFLLYTVKSTYM